MRKKFYEHDNIPQDVATEMVRLFVFRVRWTEIEEVWQGAERLREQQAVYFDDERIWVNPTISDWLLTEDERVSLFKVLKELGINMTTTY